MGWMQGRGARCGGRRSERGPVRRGRPGRARCAEGADGRRGRGLAAAGALGLGEAAVKRSQARCSRRAVGGAPAAGGAPRGQGGSGREPEAAARACGGGPSLPRLEPFLGGSRDPGRAGVRG